MLTFPNIPDTSNSYGFERDSTQDIQSYNANNKEDTVTTDSIASTTSDIYGFDSDMAGKADSYNANI
jgi:hypothetical protein